MGLNGVVGIGVFSASVVPAPGVLGVSVAGARGLRYQCQASDAELLCNILHIFQGTFRIASCQSCWIWSVDD